MSRTLFEVANSPVSKNARSMRQANTARDIILKRLVGRRRPGSHPATKKKVTVEFTDRTGEVGA